MVSAPEVFDAIKMTWKEQRNHLLISWLHVPFGILTLLAYCFGVDRIITAYIPFSFPAPVACMAILFFLLIFLDFLSLQFPRINRKTIRCAVLASTATAAATAQPHAPWTPTMPLEAKTPKEESDDACDEMRRKGEEDTSDVRRFVDPFMSVLEPPCMFCLKHMSVMFTPSFILIPARETLPGKELGLLIGWFIPSQIIAFIFPVLFYWAIDRVAHVSISRSRPPVESGISGRRVEVHIEMGEGHDRPSTALSERTGLGIRSVYLDGDNTRVNSVRNVSSAAPSPLIKTRSLEEKPSPTAFPTINTTTPTIARLTELFTKLLTPLIYITIALISLPIFYTTGNSITLFLSINLLSYLFGVLVVPPKVKKVLHPILTTSFITVFALWALGALKGLSLKQSLRLYSSGTKYLDLWTPGFHGPGPGAGDVLISVLDAGIVALAVPMYRYRQDLRAHFFRMILVIIPCASLSLFVWPLIARLYGMDSTRALAFAGRFMSTPLAIELVETVKGDESICVILVVVTGIVSTILKDYYFYDLMKVPRDDFLCVGLAMGTTSGAIGASSLLHEPRTMAIASLTFVLFGAILLAAVAVPPVVDIVRSLAGG